MAGEIEGTFTTSGRKVKTALSSDVEMCIRATDWKRIYRKVSTIPRETSVYDVIENVAWGVCGSSFLSLIPLYQATQSSEPWVKPTFWIAAIAAGIVGFIAHHFRSQRKSIIQASGDEVLADMQEVYETFFPNCSIGKTEKD